MVDQHGAPVAAVAWWTLVVRLGSSCLVDLPGALAAAQEDLTWSSAAVMTGSGAAVAAPLKVIPVG